MQAKRIAECSPWSILQYLGAFCNTLEHSAILLTFIKLPFVIKSLYCLFLSGHLTQVLLYYKDWTGPCGVGNHLAEEDRAGCFTLCPCSASSSCCHGVWSVIAAFPGHYTHLLYFVFLQSCGCLYSVPLPLGAMEFGL